GSEKMPRRVRVPASETSASHSFPHFLPGQDRQRWPLAPRHGNASQLGRSVRRQLDIGERQLASWRNPTPNGVKRSESLIGLFQAAQIAVCTRAPPRSKFSNRSVKRNRPQPL